MYAHTCMFAHDVRDTRDLCSLDSWWKLISNMGMWLFSLRGEQQSMHIHTPWSIKCWPVTCYQIHNQQLLREGCTMPTDSVLACH